LGGMQSVGPSAPFVSTDSRRSSWCTGTSNLRTTRRTGNNSYTCPRTREMSCIRSP